MRPTATSGAARSRARWNPRGLLRTDGVLEVRRLLWHARRDRRRWLALPADLVDVAADWPGRQELWIALWRIARSTRAVRLLSAATRTAWGSRVAARRIERLRGGANTVDSRGEMLALARATGAAAAWLELAWMHGAREGACAAAASARRALEADPGFGQAIAFLLGSQDSERKEPELEHLIGQAVRAVASRPDPARVWHLLLALLDADLAAAHARTFVAALNRSHSWSAAAEALWALHSEGPYARSNSGADARLPGTLRAQVIGLFRLARGETASGLQVLENLPDKLYPITIVRDEAQRLLAAGDETGARQAAAAALRRAPADRGMLGVRRAAMSNQALLRSGFPFEPKIGRPQFTPKPRVVLCLLHNSLPHHSAGYATRTQGLLTSLRDDDWDVTGVTRLGYPYDVWSSEDTREVPELEWVDQVPYRRLTGVERIVLKKPLTRYVERYSARLDTLCRQERPQVLHAASNHWNGLAAGVVAGRLGIGNVYEVRGLWEITRGSRNPEWVGSGMYRLASRLELEAALRADMVLTITRGLRDEMVDRGVPAEKIALVPNGVDPDRFTPLDRDQALEAELGLRGKCVIGYVGSTLDYEGLGLLVEAAAALKQERQDFHVLVVGDGAELGNFVTGARNLRVEDLVTFTGRVPHSEVSRFYSVIDIAPFPRLPYRVCELVSPLKPFEAMAMGKVVVVSDVAALAEIVDHQVTGLVHAKGDVGSLTAALRYLLDNPARRQSLGEAGRRWVKAERSWSHLVRRVEAVYDEVITGMAVSS